MGYEAWSPPIDVREEVVATDAATNRERRSSYLTNEVGIARQASLSPFSLRAAHFSDTCRPWGGETVAVTKLASSRQ